MLHQYLLKDLTCVQENLNLSQAYIKTVSDLLADYIHGFAYAASCNKSENKITIRMSEDPLNLIFENIRMNSEQTFSN